VVKSGEKEQNHIRGKLDLGLILLGLQGLLLDRLCRRPTAALGYLLLLRSCMFDSPIAGDVLKFRRVSDEHARHLCILRVLGFGCAEEGL